MPKRAIPTTKGWLTPNPLRLGSWLLGCRARRRRASPAEQGQGILGVEREAPHGLFARGAQRDVHAPVVGQADGQQVLKEFILFRWRQVRIVFEEFLHLGVGHVLLFTIRLGVDVIGGNALLNQIVLGAFHTALGEKLVVLLTSADVGVATENQVGIRFVG